MREIEYLQVPQLYARELGGLAWSDDCDAIVNGAGATLVITHHLASFLEGAFSRERPVHFAFVLHFLHRLVNGGISDLHEAWTNGGGSMRNAGTLFNKLTHALPRQPGKIEMPSLLNAMRRRDDLFSLHWLRRTALSPPLSMEEFEAHLRRMVEPFTRDDLRHWFRHGRGPHAMTQAPPVELPPPPRTLDGALESALKSKRLSGVAPFIDQMVAALTLPPRRILYTGLPVGGYSSVTNRGHPDQILFSEFAVDELEFLRRYAENELLYYQREEPQSQVREDLVVLLDQGVRTWGETRLMLTAAAVALGKRAARRDTPVRYATTGNGGAPANPLEEDIGGLIEASDLSPNPGLALERVLEEPAPDTRDIVLLTHPRNITDDDVNIAARRVSAGVRLFALGVDENGAAELAEIRRGAPVTLRRFRVSAPGPDTEPERHRADEGDPWTGPVEPAPFPFRFGVVGAIDGMVMDHDGAHLFTIANTGLIHAWRTDGDGFELLPRALHNNTILLGPCSHVGVPGGIVLAYLVPDGAVLVHYDTVARRMRPHHLATSVLHLPGRLDYLPRYHSVLYRVTAGEGQRLFILDLDTGEYMPPGKPGTRLAAAYKEIGDSDDSVWPPRARVVHQPPSNVLRAAHSGHAVDLPGVANGGRGIHVLHQPREGKLALVSRGVLWRAWTPMGDGAPLLKDVTVHEAVCAGETLAMRIERGRHEHVLVFKGPEWELLGQFNSQRGVRGLAISDDGHELAYRNRAANVAGLHVGDAAVRRFAAAPGKVHHELVLEAGDDWLTVYGGKFTHLLRWDRHRLEVAFLQGNRDVTEFIRRKRDASALDPRRVRAKRGKTRATQYDQDRFRQYAYSRRGMLFTADRYGEIAVFGRDEALVAMFYVNRGTVCAWLPDGTRYGPAGITGGATSPDALGKVGRALRRAQGEG